jgi:hypothetical protein
MLSHGFNYRKDPVLRPLDQIAIGDALLDTSDPTKPQEARWPDAEFIVGNPPFLGGKMLRTNLGDAYVDDLFEVYDGRVPREADFVTYWHEKARAMVAEGRTKRVGLLATQGIRGGANRKVIERIKESGDLFLAWSDEPWILDGAAVHISFLGFDDGSETTRELDGHPVASINANLTSGLDLTKARRLKENLGIAFMGDTKGGPFDITADQAARMLAAKNPDGRSNADVVRPWMNGIDVTGQPRNMWIIDFGVGISEVDAAYYEGPFEYVKWIVKPERENNKRPAYAERWWLHVEPRSGMRAALKGLPRYIATPNVTKHRLFAWLPPEVLADHQLIVFARRRLHVRCAALEGPRVVGARDGHAAARGRVGLPLHADDDLRDFPDAASDARPNRADRRCRAPARLHPDQGARHGRRRQPEGSDAHLALQQPAVVADAGAPRTRRCRAGRLRVGGGPVRRRSPDAPPGPQPPTGTRLTLGPDNRQ